VGQATGKKVSRRRGVALALASLVGSLGLAELGARTLHRGAFPFLNTFVADSRYGVRLAPEARTRVRSRLGRITEIRTDARGFRGPGMRDAATRLLLLGDSQVMGYGVDYPDTIGAQLERRLGPSAAVYAAAAPSWGPAESLLALDEIGPLFRPQTVIFFANAANDWTEVAVPNARRTTAIDGWAAGYVPDAAAPLDFPGRAWLLSRSHLVLAARQLAGYIGGAELPSADGAQLLLRDLDRLRQTKDGHRSRLTAALLAAADRCQALGCQVIAAALPLDVQVDGREWQKYHARPVDLRPTLSLLTDLVADAHDAGLVAVDLTGPLRAVEPGAFLPDDYHLSPRGAAAVADALAKRVAAPLTIAARSTP
jgi:hypothetical protein